MTHNKLNKLYMLIRSNSVCRELKKAYRCQSIK